MAKIVVNGKNEELEKSVSLSELLKLKNIRPEVVTIELNDSIVERKDYAVTIVKDGDRLELVYLMGGGENG